ncbi:MAG: EAL domain-containing protein [Sphingobium sp.]|nr:EAL domain-containing protein [Sphingobium sp.]
MMIDDSLWSAFVAAAILVAFSLKNLARRFVSIPKHKRDISTAPSEFNSLRGQGAAVAPSADDVGFVAICEVERFAFLRHQISAKQGADLLNQLRRQISSSCPGSSLGRCGRARVEFIFSAPNAAAAEAALVGLSEAIERSIQLADVPLFPFACIGFARIDEDGVTDAHIDDAEAALMEARSLRRRAVISSDLGTARGGIDHLILMRDMRRALHEGSITLHYQPKLHLRSGAIDGVEALLRWEHPDKGFANTAELIEIAEKTGQIRELSLWVNDRAAADRRMLAAAGFTGRMFVNISSVLLSDVMFTEQTIALFRDSAEGMGIEITETAIIADPDRALENLRRYHDAGLHIAVDDYGTGFSSLAHLQKLPFNELKIDRSFIADLTNSHRSPLIVRSTIELAHALELEVTAEGVDDPMILALLNAMGCDTAQGYHIARPMPLASLIPFLEQWRENGGMAATIELPRFDVVREA